MREEILNRRAGMSKTMRGKSNVDTRLGEDIEGDKAKLTLWSVRKDDKYCLPALWSEWWTRVFNLKFICC